MSPLTTAVALALAFSRGHLELFNDTKCKGRRLWYLSLPHSGVKLITLFDNLSGTFHIYGVPMWTHDILLKNIYLVKEECHESYLKLILNWYHKHAKL